MSYSKTESDYSKSKKDVRRKRSPTSKEPTLISKIWDFLSSSRMIDRSNEPKLSETSDYIDEDKNHEPDSGLEEDKGDDKNINAKPTLAEEKINAVYTPESNVNTEKIPAEHDVTNLPKKLELHDAITSDDDEKDESAPLLAQSRSNKNQAVTFDRAFMYVVRHNPTGLILHIGRYLDPS